MNFEFNKIAGAVLGTALGVMVVGIVAETIYAPRVSEQPGYVIAVAEPGEGEGEAPAAPEVAPIADRLQTASAEDGADDVAKCKTCHTFEQGGPNKVGPNLWDVVGHNVIHADFDYSDAMRAKGEEGMEWTFENLDHFIDNPKGFIPGTAMSFAGDKDPGQRADIIAYLRTLSDNPVPLPPPTPAPTAEAPAGEGEQPPATETPPGAGETPPAATESPPAEPPVAAPTEAAPPAAEPAPAATAPDAEADSPEGAPAAEPAQ
jgi:cytochrome c